jgi:hypothetical protein
MKIQKIQGPKYCVNSLLKDYKYLIKKYPLSSERQLSLTHHPEVTGNEHKVYNGVGKLAKGTLEFDYSMINEEFKELYVYKILKELSYQWHLGRTRFAQLPPRVCYSMHRDYSSYRYHIAIATNPHAYITYEEGEMCHIPADGFLYRMNTAAIHSGFNGGSEDRIHIVAELKAK